MTYDEYIEKRARLAENYTNIALREAHSMLGAAAEVVMDPQSWGGMLLNLREDRSKAMQEFINFVRANEEHEHRRQMGIWNALTI